MTKTHSPPSGVPIVGESLTTEEVAARSEASVGLISGASSSGTGFLVADGLLATNAHVIESIPPDEIHVTFPAAPELDQGPLLGRVVYFDPHRDLAMLRIATRLRPLRTAGDHRFRRGQDVVVIGNPGLGGGVGLECVVSRGVLGSKISEGPRAYYQLSGSVNPGNSGGPVLDLAGRVVGVVTLKASRQEGLGFCIPAADLAHATRVAATQPAPEATLAAQRHADAAKLPRDQNSEIAAAIERTTPATWIAMLDAGRVLDDGDSEAVAVRSILDRVEKLYEDDAGTIANLVIRMVLKLRRKQQTVMGREFLEGSLEWASTDYFTNGQSVRFAEYFQLYETYRVQNDSHADALAALRSFHAAYWARIRPRIEPAPASIRQPRRIARTEPSLERREVVPDRPPVPELATSAASRELLRLGRSLEGQKKIRGALRYYRDLVDDHPATAEAAQASERIKALSPSPTFGNRRPAQVIDVLDGRTVLVNLGAARIEVRLIGLDPLPKNHSVSPLGPWEDQTKAFLRSLVVGRSVHLDYERGVSQSDGEGHTLAYLYRSDDRLAVNREMIARGFAIGSKYGFFSQADDFRDADSRARSRKVGLWKP